MRVYELELVQGFLYTVLAARVSVAARVPRGNLALVGAGIARDLITSSPYSPLLLCLFVLFCLLTVRAQV